MTTSSSPSWSDPAPAHPRDQFDNGPTLAPGSRVLTGSAQSTEISAALSGGRARLLQGATLRDLAYATALLEAAERMQAETSLTDLLRLVATEAATVVAADGAAVVHFSGIRRQLVDLYLDPASDDERMKAAIRGVADQGWLFRPGYVSDLSQDSRWANAEPYGALPPWRSVLVVPLDGPSREGQLRLLWFSSVAGNFAAEADVAELFGRHASLAIRERPE